MIKLRLFWWWTVIIIWNHAKYHASKNPVKRKVATTVGGEMIMTIPAILKPENVLRLIEIDQRLYIMEMADRMTREEQDERRALLIERENLRREE